MPLFTFVLDFTTQLIERHTLDSIIICSNLGAHCPTGIVHLFGPIISPLDAVTTHKCQLKTLVSCPRR